MTRTATKPGRGKRALDATPWSEMSIDDKQPPPKKSTVSNKKPAASKNDGAGAVESNTSNKKIDTIKEMKRIRKSESRRIKRIDVRYTDKHCFNCRKKGHTLSDCPKMNKQNQGTGICFKCGSMNHMSRFCKMKTKSDGQGAYPYATCFVCKKTGHISKDCPDNDHGLYPNGGCCLECGSVRHFRRDCPEKQRKQGVTNYTLSTMSHSSSADLEPSRNDLATNPVKPKPVLNKRKTKIVTMT